MKKPRATEALAPLGLPPLKANLLRAEAFYKGLRARISIASVQQDLLRTPDSAQLPDDDNLKSFVAGFQAMQALLALRGKSASVAVWPHVDAAQRNIGDMALELAAKLRQSADRRKKISAFEAALRGTQLFTSEVYAQIV
ncbi:MAG: hypothetical protein ACAI35_20800, partial [Candidatus Methylacidiphilales bacterium]